MDMREADRPQHGIIVGGNGSDQAAVADAAHGPNERLVVIEMFDDVEAEHRVEPLPDRGNGCGVHRFERNRTGLR
jgi:hypothetical protein